MDILESILSIRQNEDGLRLISHGEDISSMEAADKSREVFNDYVKYEQEMLSKAFGERSKVFDMNKGLKYLRYAFPVVFINNFVKDNVFNVDSININHDIDFKGVSYGEELQQL